VVEPVLLVTIDPAGTGGNLVLGASDNLNLTAASNLVFGTTTLAETTAANDSGAYLVGTFDEFAYSASSNVQDVLDDLDSTIGGIIAGTTGIWTDAGAYLYPSAGEVLGNSSSAGANKLAGAYLADSAPLVFGTDNDITYSFSGSVLSVAAPGGSDINLDSDTNTFYIDTSANQIGIGNTSPGARLHISTQIGGYDGNLLKFDSAAEPTNYNMTLRSVVSSGLVKYHFDIVNASTSYLATLTLDRGKLGISTTAPDAALEINHATGDNLRLTYNDADGSATAYTDFSLASDGDLTIDSAGGAIISLIFSTLPEAPLIMSTLRATPTSAISPPPTLVALVLL